MVKILFITAIALLFVGCATTQPSITEYTINTNIHSGDSSSKGCFEKSLKVSQAFSTSNLMSLKMNYAQGDYEQFVYSESQWADSPNRAVTSGILKLLREAKLFKSVQTDKSRSKNDFILETNIEDFMQYFSNDSKESYANIVISLTLIDSNTSLIVATKTLSFQVKANTLDAKGGVEALSKALENILVQARDWLGEVCK